MPFTSDFVENGRGLHFHGVGEVTGDEILTTKHALATQTDRLRGIQYILVDFQQVTEFPVTADDVRRIVEVDEKLAKIAPHAFIALVAPKDLVFGMARMWEVLAQNTGWSIGVFRSRKEADDWLHYRVAQSA